MKSTRSTTISTPESDLDSALSNEALRAQVKQLRDDNRYLREQLELLKRHIFGHKSEKLPAALLGAESDLFGVQAPDPSLGQTKPIAAHDRALPKAGHGRVALPDNLPCETTVLDVPEADKTCPCCGMERVHIGDDVSEHASTGSAQVWTSSRPNSYAAARCVPKWPAASAPNAAWPRPSRR